MFFADKPYISDFFRATVRDNGIPIVGTKEALQLNLYSGTEILSEADVLSRVRHNRELQVYTTSENAIGWLAGHDCFSELSEKIDLFKDKLKFRKMIQPMFPEFYFRGVSKDKLKALPVAEIPFPVVLKPTVGFFSMGVHIIADAEEWRAAVACVLAEIEQIKGLYPKEVLGTGSFILEQLISGEEFAIDAYYNRDGEPVILGIFSHAFSSDNDVSDRVYTTSKAIIEDNLAGFTDFMKKLGRLSAVKNFPVHIELRRQADGMLVPIEVNPMRFGGWCSTPDMTFHAYGMNPYLACYFQQKPDWSELLRKKDGKLFSLIVLDNSTGKEGQEIASFDYKKLLTGFEKVLELRRIDYKTYPVFGFLFVESRADNYGELQTILDSDLNEFVVPAAVSECHP